MIRVTLRPTELESEAKAVLENGTSTLLCIVGGKKCRRRFLIVHGQLAEVKSGLGLRRCLAKRPRIMSALRRDPMPEPLSGCAGHVIPHRNGLLPHRADFQPENKASQSVGLMNNMIDWLLGPTNKAPATPGLARVGVSRAHP